MRVLYNIFFRFFTAEITENGTVKYDYTALPQTTIGSRNKVSCIPIHWCPQGSTILPNHSISRDLINISTISVAENYVHTKQV